MELVELDFFPESCKYWSAPRASEKLASRPGPRAAPADLWGGERAARNLICSPFAEVLPPPCGSQWAHATARPRPPPRCFAPLWIFGAQSSSALRRRRTSWSSPGSRLLANSNSVAMGRSVLNLAQCGRPSAQGQKGGDTSSLARCHQTRNEEHPGESLASPRIERDRDHLLVYIT